MDGKELVEWWTTIVRDLDLIEEVHNAGNGRTRPWRCLQKPFFFTKKLYLLLLLLLLLLSLSL